MQDDELDWQKNVKPLECGKITLKDDHKINIKPIVNNRLLSKFAFERQVLGAHGAENRSVYEDLSTGVTTQLPTKVEFRKKSNGLQENYFNANDASIQSCLDYNTKSKIDKGKYFISDRLDLHGHNIEDAYYKLIDFVIKNYQAGNRCLLIITGYGNATNKTGAIKNNLYKWLNDTKIQHMVLYHQQAKKEHGGKGAFYVLLRRFRV